jgi:hypothetical protein
VRQASHRVGDIARAAARALSLLTLPAVATAQIGRTNPIAPTTPAIPAPGATVPAIDALFARPASELTEIVNRYTADRAALGRRYEVDYSSARRSRMREFYSGWQTQLRGIDFRKLGLDGRVDYLLLDGRIRYELELLRRDQKEYGEMAMLLPFAPRLMQLQETRRRMEAIESPRIAEMLAKTAKEIDSLRKVFDRPQPKADSAPVIATGARAGGPGSSAEPAAGPAQSDAPRAPAARSDTSAPSDSARGDSAKTAPRVSRVVAHRAATEIEALRRTLEGWNRYYSGYDPSFSWWVADPYKRADSALKSYVKVLRERIVGYKEGQDPPIVGDPIGSEGLKADLAVEMLTYTPAELIAIADREFAWCETEMKKASREMGFGDDWKAALEKVKQTYVDPGMQPELIRDLAWEATAFVEQRGLVTIPPLAKEIWRMEMMTPEAQKESPFFLGGEVIRVSFPTSTMEHEDKLMSMRGNNPYFSRATVHHELIPGHHLQGFMRARYNTHRGIFNTPFWSEGWALYWEMLLWDEGFPRTPEEKIGMLFWRMHRAARIIFSLSFHEGTMTPQQAVDFLVDRVGHERANATAEVRRSFDGSYSPLYQAAYMMGGLQLRALHKELVGSRKLTNRQFHDTILQSGAMPIEMVRALLTRQQLTRDYVASWRFAG